MPINAKKERKSHHLNWMGGESYDISNPISRLRMAAASCFFGEPQYYSTNNSCGTKHGLSTEQLDYLRRTLDAQDPQEWRSLSSSEMMERAIDEALQYDAEATLQMAVKLRNEDNIRTTPQVILVRAANTPSLKGTGLVRQYASEIIRRADEPATCLAYQLAKFGKPVPNSLKRSFADFLRSANEYSLAKYRMNNRGVKTVDVVNLTHVYSEPINKLMNGTLKNETTWESMRSNGQPWEECIPYMGHMALLRNLRNMSEVDPSLYIPKLTGTVIGGKQLPFRYYSAYCACKDHVRPQVLDAIEQCLETSLQNLPSFSGKTISLCDNSGSARGSTTSEMGTVRVSTIGNLTGVITGLLSDEGYVGVFGDRLSTIAIRKKSSIFDAAYQVDELGTEVGASTENGIWIFFRDAIAKHEWWDNIFVYSDMQAGHGELYGVDPREYRQHVWQNSRNIDVAKLTMQYRTQVNPNVNIFLVQIAGYQDTIVPEYYNRTYILGGWSSGLLKFAHNMIALNNPRN